MCNMASAGYHKCYTAPSYRSQNGTSDRIKFNKPQASFTVDTKQLSLSVVYLLLLTATETMKGCQSN